MRVLLGLVGAVSVISAVAAAPLQQPPDDPVFRGQPVGYWIGRLKARDWPTRLDGAHGLRELGADAWPAVSDLIAALDDDDSDVRLMVVKALGSIGAQGEKALPRLAANYERASGKERNETLRALLRIDVRSDAALGKLRKALRDKDPDHCEFALRCAVQVADLEDKELLVAARAALANPSEQLRTTAGAVMVHLGREAHSTLLDLVQGTDKTARNAAIAILISLDDLDADSTRRLVDVFAGLLSERDEVDSAAICGTLEKLGRTAAPAAPALANLLKDDALRFRLRAARALLKVDPDRAPEAVACALAILKVETLPECHSAAVDVLARAGPAATTAVPLLVKMAGKDSIDAIKALGDIGPTTDDVVPALFDVLARPEINNELREVAAAAVQKIGPRAKPQLPKLRGYLRDDLDPDVARRLATALADIGCDDDAVIQLLRVRPIADVDDVVRMGRLAQTSKRARDELVACIKAAQSNSLQATLGGGVAYRGSDHIVPEAIRQLLALRDMPPEISDLLNEGNPYAQVAAYYLVKKTSPSAIAGADRSLLEGDQQPTLDGKTLAQWLRQARHEDPRKRVDALQHLAKLEYPRLVVPVLLDALDDEVPDVRAQATEVMHSYPAAVDFLLASASFDRGLRARLLAAPSSLVRTYYGLDGPMALFLARDADPFNRLLADRLLNSEDKDNLNALVEAMERERAIRPLAAPICQATNRYQQMLSGRFGDGSEVSPGRPPRILFAMALDADIDQSCAGLAALARRAQYSEDLLTLLDETLGRKEPEVRRLTVEALGTFDSFPGRADFELSQRKVKNVPPLGHISRLLMGALKDPAAEVRLAAARSLAKVGPGARIAVDSLREHLQDPDTGVRVTAAEALWHVDPGRQTNVAVQTLRDALNAEHSADRRAALRALQHMGRAAAVAFPEVVVLAQHDRGRTLGDDAVKAMGSLAPRQSELNTLVVEFLADQDRLDLAGVAGLVDETLTPEQARSGVSLLEKLVFADDRRVRNPAVEALGRLGPAAKPAVPTLLDRLRADDFKNDTCVSALERIIDRNSEQNESARQVVAFLLYHSAEPHSPALEVCSDLIFCLGSEAEVLLPNMLRDADGCLCDSRFRYVLPYMSFTEKSVPFLAMMVQADNADSTYALLALRKLGPRAAAALPTLQSVMRSRRHDDTTCQTLLAIEPRPSALTKEALLRMQPDRLLRLTRAEDSSEIIRNLAHVGPEFNQVLQTLVEAVRTRNNNQVACEVFQFIAAMGEQSGYILPELFELQREIDTPYLWMNTSYDKITSDNLWRTSRWSTGPADESPLWRESSYDRGEAQPLRAFLRKLGKPALPVLARYLKDFDPKLRLFAAYCAALLGPEARELADAMQAALKNRDGFPDAKEDAREYRFDAFYTIEMLHALAAVGPPKDIAKDLQPLLKHKFALVPATAVWLLAQPGVDREQALTALTLVPENADPMVRLQVVLTRLRLDGREEKAVQDLNHFLDDERYEVHVRAAQALCKLGRAARLSMGTFRKWAKSEVPLERVLAAEAHWAIAGETQAAVSLCIAFIDEDRGSKYLVVDLLDRIGPEAEPARAAQHR